MVEPSSNINLTEIISDIPKCALGCLSTALTSSPTALSNLTATCTNNTLQRSLTICVKGNCNTTDQIRISSLATSQLCAGVPIESLSEAIITVGLVTGGVALLTVALRFYSRYSMRNFGADDWTVVVAAVLLLPLLTLQSLVGSKYGVGKHIWNVNLVTFLQGLEVLYVVDMLYVTTLGLIKSSILLFYLRLFPYRWFINLSRAVLASIVASVIAIVLSLMFQCKPISGAWDLTIHAQCLNVNTLTHVAGGISIAQDFVILMLPIPICVGLNMKLKKKLNVLFMFGIGGIASLISILRFKYLNNVSRSTDPTWDNSIPLIWSYLEINMAIICACLPALRALLSRVIPSVFEINSPPESKFYKARSANDSYAPSCRFPKIHTHNAPDKGVIVSLEELPSHTMHISSEVKVEPGPVSPIGFKGNSDIQLGNETKIWARPRVNEADDIEAHHLERPSASDSETSLIVPR